MPRSQATQQFVQSQILQHLQSTGAPLPAVGGTMPPPPPGLVVAVQQVLQHQQLLQRLQLQQVTIQAKTPAGLRPSPDPSLQLTIGKIRQQIAILQAQINVYRQQMMQAVTAGGGGVPFDTGVGRDIAKEFTAALQVRGGDTMQPQHLLDSPVVLPPTHLGESLLIPSSSQFSTSSSGLMVNGWPNWPVSSSSPSHVSRLVSLGSSNETTQAPATGLDIEEFIPGKPWQGSSGRVGESDTPRGPNFDDAQLIGAAKAWSAGAGWQARPDQIELINAAVLASKGLLAAKTPPGLSMPNGPWQHAMQQHPSFARSTSWAPKSSHG